MPPLKSMPRNSSFVASGRKTNQIGPEKKVKRGARLSGKFDRRCASYKEKVDAELLNQATRYKTFYEYVRASAAHSPEVQFPRHNEILIYSSDGTRRVIKEIIPLPLPNQSHKPTIDATTLTRGAHIDANDPNFLSSLIQGYLTPLPKRFAELQGEVPFWTYCFEKTGKILAELVHQSLHNRQAECELARLRLAYLRRGARAAERLKFQMTPHIELLAMGINLGLSQEDVTANDRAEFLDTYCPQCPRRPDDEPRHPITSTHRLWRSLIALKEKFSAISGGDEPRSDPAISSANSRKRIEGLSTAAWKGLQQMRIATPGHGTDLMEYLLWSLELSESLSAEQRALRHELREMTPAARQSLSGALRSGARRI